MRKAKKGPERSQKTKNFDCTFSGSGVWGLSVGYGREEKKRSTGLFLSPSKKSKSWGRWRKSHGLL